MSMEGRMYDRKSIRYALGKSEDMRSLAADCVGLANAAGGVIHLGIEDEKQDPPAGQRIPADLPDRLRKRIIRPEVIDLMGRVDQEFQPTQRESIALGFLAQHEILTGKELAHILDLSRTDELDPWITRLRDWGLITVRGRTKGARYAIAPDVLRRFRFRGRTSLKRIEDHRLRELIIQDLGIYGKASRSEIHGRIGVEIPEAKLRRMLNRMVGEGSLIPIGERRWRRYRLPSSIEVAT